MTYFATRSQAARAAKRAGHTKFMTKDFPVTPGRAWKFHPMDNYPSPAAEWAKGKDYVNHVETHFIDEGRAPGVRGVLVVTCFTHEIPPEDKAEAEALGFTFEPITPSLWKGDEPNKTALVGAARGSTTGGAGRAKSDVESPVKVVWRIADEMKGAARAEIIAACVASGVNKATASTQLYRWQKAQKQ